MEQGDDWLFAYGTLQRGQRHHDVVARFVREVREGWLKGALVELGGHPGWVPSAGRVRGEVFRVEPSAPALAALDELEAYFGPGDPRNEYERVRTRVTTPAGRLEAWAYRYARPVARLPAVPGERWPPA